MSANLVSSPTLDFGIQPLPSSLTQADWLSVNVIEDKVRFSLRISEEHRPHLSNCPALNVPEKINTASTEEEMLVFCLGPDEWLIIASKAQAKLLKAEISTRLNAIPYSLVDISHRQIALQLDGAFVEDVLSVGCPIDLCLAQFPIGKVTRTIIERAEITLYRSGENTFHLEVWRSFAPYVLSLLEKGYKLASIDGNTDGKRF